MRILMSIHQELDPRTGTGGVTCELANVLRAHGHTVDIVSFERLNLPRRFKAYIYPWFIAWYIFSHPRYDILDLSSRDGWVYSFLSRVSHAESRPVILARSHGLELIDHEARLKASRAGAIKLSWTYPIYKGGFRLWECRTSFSCADAALLLNRVEVQYAVDRLGIKRSRAIQISNGIASSFIEHAKALQSSGEVSEPPRSVAFISRYNALKGAQFLCEAMTAVLRRFQDATLGLFGTGIDPDIVLADFPYDIRNRIEVVKSYDNDELPSLLAAYQILAFPSLFEGFGLAPLEAMACGLVPIVAASPGPTSYIRDGINGILVPVGDSNAMEFEIVSLMQDSPRWNEMRCCALKTAVEYSWDNVASKMEETYANLATRSRK